MLAAALAADARAALQVLGYQPRLHDRFYTGPDRAFIGEGQPWSRPYDWSGAGRFWDPVRKPDGSPYTSWWAATMISENYFLTAAHVHPSRYFDDPEAPLPKVRFHRTNAYGTTDYWESEIEIPPDDWEYTGFKIDGADLWVSKLAETPPDWVRRYPLVKRKQQTNWISYVDPTVYIFGAEQEWHWYTSSRLGRNTIDHRSGSVISYDVTSPPGLGADEARSIGGDSSYPSFVITPAGPTLYSLNVGSGVGPTMLDFHDEIRTALAAVGENVAVVTDLLGDLDADYDVDSDDSAILESHFGAPNATYVRGDLNRDGTIDDADRAAMTTQLGKFLRAPADFTGDDVINGADFQFIADNWLQPVAPLAGGDATGDGLVSRDDVVIFEANRIDPLAGVPPVQIAGDANFDGAVNNADLQLWAANLHRTDVPAPFFTSGDVTGDSVVDFGDLAIIRDHYGALHADVNGDSKIDLADVDVVIANWQQSTSGGLAAGDVDGDGAIDATDLQAVGASLGSLFRRPLPSRIAGIVPGDFNGDMYIDGADLLVWQRALGSTFAPAIDANKNGVVDAADLAVWSANLLLASGGGPETLPAPEPAAYFMAGVAFAVLLRWRRRSHESTSEA